MLGLRPSGPLRDPAPPESDPALVERIAAEIEAGGPITFARFMELALYDPAGGYYRSGAARPGRAGDYITAPETHPIFGWTLARQAAQVWELLGRPDPFVIREHGAGTGALISALIDGLAVERRAMLETVRYQPVEVEPRRLDALADRLRAAGHGDCLAPPGPGESAPAVTGLILANEVLDALPVHRVRGLHGGELEELFVTRVDGTFAAAGGSASTPALAARLAAEGVALRPGQEAEICLELDGWVAARAGELRRGLLLLIDYGHPATELYDGVRRPRGTLLGYRSHRAVDDPFQGIGRQDLTAHVDVTAVERAAVGAGLAVAGITTQAELLVSLGAGDLLTDLRDRPGTTAEAYLAARMSLVRLIDPAAMGRFRVMAFARDLPTDPPLAGFSFRLPAR
jgi:SAM-dependent MidA family methyltransferase